uniref:Fe2OG dioxygenase domain-containing protein n=1 Tax=Rhizophora mucronata TaxID=61149 RepID=A0A2P2JRA4_RHIMU
MEVSFLKQTAFEPKTISPINGNVSAANDTGTDDTWYGVDRELPIIDYTMFKSDDPAQRSKVIENLGKWCQEYGFFIVKNHPVPENLIKETIDKFMEFFDQTEEEKFKYSTRDPDDRIRFFQGDKNIISREYLYVTTHPTLHCPDEPPTLTETVREFSGRVRELGIELLRGISESLGFEQDYIEKKLTLESSFDFLTVNDYPARQCSTNRLGQVEHSDTGLFTLVTQNTNGGLQLEHNGQWLNVNIKPDWIACNVADFLEV